MASPYSASRRRFRAIAHAANDLELLPVLRQADRSDTSAKNRRCNPDWDFMELDENSAELVGCSCFSDPEFLAIREGHSKELDLINEANHEH